VARGERTPPHRAPCHRARPRRAQVEVRLADVARRRPRAPERPPEPPRLDRDRALAWLFTNPHGCPAGWRRGEGCPQAEWDPLVLRATRTGGDSGERVTQPEGTPPPDDGPLYPCWTRVLGDRAGSADRPQRSEAPRPDLRPSAARRGEAPVGSLRRERQYRVER